MTRARIFPRGFAALAAIWLVVAAASGCTQDQGYAECSAGYYWYSPYGCVPLGYFYGPPYYAYPDFGFGFFYGVPPRGRGGWDGRHYGPSPRSFPHPPPSGGHGFPGPHGPGPGHR